jgi:methionyl-tRNA formyltransferase
MQITLLCNNPLHPVNEWLDHWQKKHKKEHDVILCRDQKELPGGDLLFLVSCSQIIDESTRNRYKYTLVLHASDLPLGRGWSPHVWAILEGAQAVTVSLLQAEDSIDTGAIWAKRSFSVPKDALYDEINRCLFETELMLMDEAILLIKSDIKPQQQLKSIKPTYYRKRTPQDSEVDASQPLDKIFNKIRIMDPSRYPAFFHLHGYTYTIKLKKVKNNEVD